MPASFMRTLVAALALSVGALTAPPGAAAQSMLGRAEATTTNADAAFYYVRAGTASVRVQVLGAVRAPGLYEVSEGTALGPVLALAGGPTLGTTSSDTRTDVTLRLHRPGPGGSELVFEGPFEASVAQGGLPALRDGDVLVTEVRSRRTFGWRDAVQIVGAVGVLALAIDRLADLGN